MLGGKTPPLVRHMLLIKGASCHKPAETVHSGRCREFPPYNGRGSQDPSGRKGLVHQAIWA